MKRTGCAPQRGRMDEKEKGPAAGPEIDVNNASSKAEWYRILGWKLS